ncbi:hypothetical protein [Lentzea cavernae]|uniref:Uncharacterized protein n=1 Tax=Lentzea cavernae TaxID=2020703 RepID=A0ABQ3MVC0_9PSEU|nr:hypothetical protein [Lentzea cavernae]GHH58921.1 hypothetical protein GCM10017774_81060 [Lentzea cavernae]
MNGNLVVLLAGLVLVGVVLYVRKTASTARRAERSSETAVSAAKLAIVTATTQAGPLPDDVEQGRIRTFLLLDESSIMSLYGQTPHAAAEARIREVERGTSREGSLGLSSSLVEAGGKRSGSETVRETFEAETNAARALDVVLRHLVASDQLVRLDLTAGAAVRPSLQGYVKVKAAFHITLSDNDITVAAPGLGFTVPRSRVLPSAAGVLVDGATVTAICFGRAVRWDGSTVVVLPTALYLA